MALTSIPENFFCKVKDPVSMVAGTFAGWILENLLLCELLLFLLNDVQEYYIYEVQFKIN